VQRRNDRRVADQMNGGRRGAGICRNHDRYPYSGGRPGRGGFGRVILDITLCPILGVDPVAGAAATGRRADRSDRSGLERPWRWQGGRR
jgi:hypothetical protein